MNADVRELDQEELSFADKSDFVVALVCSHVLAATAGWILHEQYIAKKLAETPVVVVQRVQPRPAALTQWSCADQEFREHRESCKQRERSALIKPK